MVAPKQSPPVWQDSEGTNNKQLSETNNSTAFNEALAAHKRGWSVFPLGGGGDFKTPTVKTWKPFQSRRPTLRNLRAWRNREFFALVTGKSSDVVLLVIDPRGVVALEGKTPLTGPYSGNDAIAVNIGGRS